MSLLNYVEPASAAATPDQLSAMGAAAAWWVHIQYSQMLVGASSQ
jgi:hypothetical protein